ncbi:Mini-ribonuclease 3 [bacterium]|nr:Mini-ribonuclease 3 [bacterium]
MENMNLRNCAYLGDAVWELLIREKTIFLTENSKKLHEITTSKVKTDFQAKTLEKIEPYLSETEKDIARRARNLPIPIGRRSIQNEYRHATAFEALIGYWYLSDKSRFDVILNKIGLNEEEFCK